MPLLIVLNENVIDRDDDVFTCNHVGDVVRILRLHFRQLQSACLQIEKHTFYGPYFAAIQALRLEHRSSRLLESIRHLHNILRTPALMDPTATYLMEIMDLLGWMEGEVLYGRRHWCHERRQKCPYCLSVRLVFEDVIPDFVSTATKRKRS